MRRALDGSVGLTLLLPLVVAAALVLVVGVAVGAVQLADARASDASDAAAIAAVHARLAGHTAPCAAAAHAVTELPGDARVVACGLTDDGGARVTVAVRVPTDLVALLGAADRRAEAAAAPVWAPDGR